MNPPIEDLLDKVDSKFTLVALSSKRARQINSYYNQLGEGLGVVVPPQVTSVSGKPLTIAFEEISAGKATFHRPEPGEEDETEGAADLEAVTGVVEVTEAAAAAEIVDVDILAVADAGAADVADVADVAEVEVEVEVVASTDDAPELPADQ
jgi:DNA-directed RNA polymerase subunit omega